jgi:hypothetical protein
MSAAGDIASPSEMLLHGEDYGSLQKPLSFNLFFFFLWREIQGIIYFQPMAKKNPFFHRIS